MSLVDIVSVIAVSFTSIACVPQIFKVWMTRSAKDISYLWIAIYSTGCCFWLTYGYLSNNHVIMTADTIVLSVQMILLNSKLYIDGKYAALKAKFVA